MTAAPTLADVVAVLDGLYDPATAESWDAVGLVAGDPTAEVRRVLFAVDPVAPVAQEALAADVDLVVTHHPLLLRAVHSVAATTPKGRLLHRLITGGCALHVAHTNADVADPGVSDALALALGVRGVAPLAPQPLPALDKVVTFVPHADAARVLDALAAAGAGAIGDYSRCAFTSTGTGTFLPGESAHPAVGTRGRVEEVPETRLEMVLRRGRRSAVVEALRAAHPYEEPAYDVLELASLPGRTGLGRVGELAAATTLREFTAHVARSLPATAWGVRAGGEPDRRVQRVAVCGGAGGELAAAAESSGADVLVTSDLRHHHASEALEEHGVALVDAAHWATEWPWLADAAARLRAGLAARGTTVETRVSTLVTDPWTVAADAEERSAAS